MTNSERLRQSTELLAARGQGFSDGLRWALREIQNIRFRDYDSETGCISDIESEIEKKLENPSI